MNIVTTFENPPIASRKFDWSAIDADTYDGEGSPVGRGATEQAARADLLSQMGATCEEVADELARAGFSSAQIAWLMNEPRYETA